MTKDERIAELEREVKEKDELIKQLGEANKFLSSDKAVSTEQVKQIAREEQLKVMKENIEIIYSTIRHQVCDEIRAFFDVNPDTVEWDYLNEILNQVEGENDGK